MFIELLPQLKIALYLNLSHNSSLVQYVRINLCLNFISHHLAWPNFFILSKTNAVHRTVREPIVCLSVFPEAPFQKGSYGTSILILVEVLPLPHHGMCSQRPSWQPSFLDKICQSKVIIIIKWSQVIFVCFMLSLFCAHMPKMFFLPHDDSISCLNVYVSDFWRWPLCFIPFFTV